MQLTYFIDVVQQHSFTLAAKKNFVSQTAISQQVAKMEGIIGAQLINRNVKPFELTSVGKIVYTQAQMLLQQYTYMFREIEVTKNVDVPVISVGYLSNVGNQVITRILSQIQEQHPKAKIEVQNYGFGALNTQLLTGNLDFAIGLRSGLIDDKLSYLSIHSGNYSLMVNPKSKLARLRLIPGFMLAKQNLIVQNRETLGPAYSILLAHCREDGYNPKITKIVDNPQTAAMLVALNQGIAFITPEQEINLSSEQVIIRPMIRTHHHYELVLAKRKRDNRSIIEQIWSTLS